MNLVTKYFAGEFGYIQFSYLDGSLPPAPCASWPRTENFGLVIGGNHPIGAARRCLIAAVPSP
jgi:hypothetical protein